MLRVKRGLIALALVGAAFVVGVAGWKLANLAANLRVTGELDALKRQGHPVALAELAPQAVPAENNAATFLKMAQPEVTALDKQVLAVVDEESSVDQDAFFFGRVNDTILQAMRTALAEHPETVPALIEASHMTAYDPQLDLTDAKSVFDGVQSAMLSAQATIRVLRYHALVQLADQQFEPALDTCLAMFRLIRLYQQQPTVANYVMTLAARGTAIQLTNRILRSGPVGDAPRASLDAELTQHDLVRDCRVALGQERAVGVARFQERIANPHPSQSAWFGTITYQQLHYLELIQAMIDVVDRPYADAAARQKVLDLYQQSGAATKEFAPAVQTVQQSTLLTLTHLRALRVLNAIQRREAQGIQDTPQVTDLGLPAEVIVDPYNSNSLILKRVPQGWVIYAVGIKLQDGGGQNLGEYKHQDIGLEPVDLPRPHESPAPDSSESTEPEPL